jgi:hypothetical protein
MAGKKGEVGKKGWFILYKNSRLSAITVADVFSIHYHQPILAA